MKLIYTKIIYHFEAYNNATPTERHPFSCDFTMSDYDSPIKANLMEMAWRLMRLPEGWETYDKIQLKEISIEVFDKEF